MKTALDTLSFGNSYVKTGLTAALTTGVTGTLSGDFSWKAVATSAISAPIGQVLGETIPEVVQGGMKSIGLNTPAWVADGFVRVARGAVTQRVRMSVYGKGQMDWGSLSLDAFGNAIGNALGESIVAQSQPNPASAYGHRNGSDIEDDNFGTQRAYNTLIEHKATEDVARKYAPLFRELAADPTNPLSYGMLDKDVGAQAFVRPSDREQAAAYDKVRNMDGKSATDAWLVAKDVANRQRLDTLGASIADVAARDPAAAARMRAAHQLGVYALLNREVYFKAGELPELLPAGWGRVTDAQGLARASLTADMLENNASGYAGALYRNDADGRYVYANRGTDDGKDWVNNFLQSVTGKSAQYSHAMDIARSIAQSEISSKITFTGHSLGGGLASAQAYVTGIAAVTFNAAGLNRATVGELGSQRMDQQPGLVKAYSVNGELLTAVQGGSPGALTAAAAVGLAVPGLGLAALAAMGAAPQAAGQRITMQAMNDPSYANGTWSRGSTYSGWNPKTALDLHGMYAVVESVMARTDRWRP